MLHHAAVAYLVAPVVKELERVVRGLVEVEGRAVTGLRTRDRYSGRARFFNMTTFSLSLSLSLSSTQFVSSSPV